MPVFFRVQFSKFRVQLMCRHSRRQNHGATRRLLLYERRSTLRQQGEVIVHGDKVKRRRHKKIKNHNYPVTQPDGFVPPLLFVLTRGFARLRRQNKVRSPKTRNATARRSIFNPRFYLGKNWRRGMSGAGFTVKFNNSSTEL